MEHRRYSEEEQAFLILLDDAVKGLEDVAAGRTEPALEAIEELRRKRQEPTP